MVYILQRLGIVEIEKLYANVGTLWDETYKMIVDNSMSKTWYRLIFQEEMREELTIRAKVDQMSLYYASKKNRIKMRE